jgi:hypothetical protein
VALLALLLARSVPAALLEGVTSRRGVLTPGVRIYALPGPDFDPRGEHRLVSPPSGADGLARMDLPAGKYHLVAYRGGGKGKGLQPGDLYCYFSGNPVEVGREGKVPVGFNLITIPADAAAGRGFTGVEGKVLFEDKPLGRCYLYVYTDAKDEFRGLGFTVVPVGPQGTFRVGLPPGSYYLIARQRQGGGMAGPIRKNDRVGYYYGNPVRVLRDETRRVEVEVTARLDNLEEAGVAPDAGAVVRGEVRSTSGKPLGNLVVLFYQTADLSGRPSFVSERTDDRGAFIAQPTRDGVYYLLARENLGGPPEEGEYYGVLAGRDGKPSPVTLGPGASPRLVVTVDRHRGAP